jgi:hypothetical protein
METDGFSSVCLEEYLEVCPKPALVLVSNRRPSPGASLKVCYSNRAFFEILGDNENFPAVNDVDEEDSDNLSSILQRKCVHPTTSQFVKWIDAVVQNPGASQDSLLTSFETTFEASKSTTPEADTSQRTFVEIEWDAVVLQKKYILLTGKTVGIVSSGDGESSNTNEPPPCPPLQETPTAFVTLPLVPDTSYIPNSGTHATKAVSPGVSGRNTVIELGRRAESFTTTYFTEQSPHSELSSPKGVDPWRHHEKVNSIATFLIVDFEAYRWRRDHGCHAP